MDLSKLREIQDPLKALYRKQPNEAVAELYAEGYVDLDGLLCHVQTPFSDVSTTASALHPKAGGEGQSACSGDMLLQALVACSGVTLAAVATAMQLKIAAAFVEAKGTMDFRGTLGVDRSVPIGLTSIAMTFRLTSDEPPDKLDKLVELTERYCVVLQTLQQGLSVVSQRA